MKKLAILLFIIPLISTAQEKNNKNYVENIFSLDLGLTGAQMGAEIVVGNDQTVLFRAGVAPVVYSSYSLYFGETFELAAVINLTGEYRYYYNFPKRDDQGKDIHNNGGNYLGFHLGYFSNPLARKEFYDETSAIFISTLWGFNRPLGKIFIFNFNVGPALAIGLNNRTSGFTLVADARFLIKLNRSKSIE